MAKIKVRYFVTRQFGKAPPKYYWIPGHPLKKAGWKIKTLDSEYARAISQAQAINHDVDRWRAGMIKAPTTSAQGTINRLIEKYKNAREYKELRPRTQKDYNYYLRIISDWGGEEQSTSITSKAVNVFYESIAEKTPTKAAYLMRVLRLLFSFAERRSIIPRSSNRSRASS